MIRSLVPEQLPKKVANEMGTLMTRVKAMFSKFESAGAFTPTLQAIALVSSFAGPNAGRFQRINDTVLVSGLVTVTPTGAGSVQFQLSLPIPSNVSQIDLFGTCVGYNSVAGYIQSFGTNSRDSSAAFFVIEAPDALPRTYWYTFTYPIQ